MTLPAQIKRSECVLYRPPAVIIYSQTRIDGVAADQD